MVDIKYVKTFKDIIPLKLLKECKEIQNMQLVKKGSRLSVQPVLKSEYIFITKLANYFNTLFFNK